MKAILVAMVGAAILAGCTTHINNKDDTIIPPKVPFGKFTQVMIKPLANNTPEEFPQKAVNIVQQSLDKCMSDAFNGSVAYDPAKPDAGVPALQIEPTILDGKKVSVAQRLFFGAFAGSSAVLMEVRFTDINTKEVIAQPIFYAKAAAMGGAWTFGATDNSMLSRLPQTACDYVKQHQQG
jgi:hypothetical protein